MSVPDACGKILRQLGGKKLPDFIAQPALICVEFDVHILSFKRLRAATRPGL